MASEYPKALESLIKALGRLPGIGRRTAERLATALLDWDDAELKALGEAIATLRDRIGRCEACGNLAEAKLCTICANPRRDPTLLCIVEQARQIPVIEKCGRFRGLYHVLGGRLSPLAGVAAGDLNLEQLYRRVPELGVQEVILSTSSDVEGEATAAYVAEELRHRFEVRVSRIALGIPVGADLSYADAATMAMAIDSRRDVR